MFIKNTMKNSTENILKLKEKIETADAIVIGAGAGMSSSAGMIYDGTRFNDNFADFEKEYGFHDMYSGSFYPFKTPEEKWAFMSRLIYLNRYDQPVGQAYRDLFELIRNKDYFVITTNVDHRFQAAGFDKDRLFYTQGDYGLFQCSTPCSHKTYDNEDAVRHMRSEQKNMKIPSGRIPVCPVCRAPMQVNLRASNTFVEDEGWHDASRRYEDFLRANQTQNILYLELGVGMNTPGIIKFPFWQMTYQNPNAFYVSINLGDATVPNELTSRSICISEDIGKVLSECM